MPRAPRSNTPPAQRIEDFTPIPGVPRPNRRARRAYRFYMAGHKGNPGFKLLRAECAEIRRKDEPVMGGIEFVARLLGKTIKTIIPNRGEPWDEVLEG